MTNSELQDAITAANAMVKATGQDSRTYAPLLEHLHALLKLQQQRAEHPGHRDPTWVPPATQCAQGRFGL